MRRKSKNLQRNKQLFNLETAKSFGIVFQVKDEDSFNKIREYLKLLTSLGKDVFAIAYVNKKETPHQYLMHPGINLFNRKDLNWFGIPKHPQVIEFMHKNLDVLVDLNFEYSFPLSWIVKLSKAKLKVGKKSVNEDMYDFMIDTDKNDVDYFTQQLMFYLEQIKLA